MGGAVHGAVSDASVESLVLMCLTVIQHLIHTQGLIQHVIDAICVHVTAALQFFLAADGALASPTCPNLCFPRPSLSLSPLLLTPPPPPAPQPTTQTPCLLLTPLLIPIATNVSTQPPRLHTCDDEVLLQAGPVHAVHIRA